MRFGLVSLYSFRPHVEHLYYLSTLLKADGHELFFLTCDAGLDSCYARAIKGTSKLLECPSCIAGGMRSFPVKDIYSISKIRRVSLSEWDKHQLSFSTACTLSRTETQDDVKETSFNILEKKFYSSIEIAYGNASRWIKENDLDGVICFNGRMDATRAITYACEKQNVPFLTLERTWFGDGLQLNPQGNCLSLRDIVRLNAQYKDIPLTYNQAQYAAQLIASRFAKTNLKEWRAYNLQSIKTAWPSKVATGPKVLILPSSRNEFQGHPDYDSAWNDYGDAFDLVLKELGIAPENVVLRCHPNWGEKIGIATGEKSEIYYVNWARNKGIHCISSKETANTFDLIQDCDILVVNGSTAALEAGACGKKIICIGHSTYEDAGIAMHLMGPEEVEKLRSLEAQSTTNTIRSTLRYAYTMARRFAQYVDYVEGVSSTTYRYFDGADPSRIINALMSGVLEPDDKEISIDDKDEKKIISLMSDRKWAQLAAYACKRKNTLKTNDIGRRYGLRWLDRLREKLPKGDVWHGK